MFQRFLHIIQAPSFSKVTRQFVTLFLTPRPSLPVIALGQDSVQEVRHHKLKVKMVIQHRKHVENP